MNSTIPPDMACLQKLKEDLNLLERLFPKTHERFQVCYIISLKLICNKIFKIMSASLDELTVKFIEPTGKVLSICANIQVLMKFFN